MTWTESGLAQDVTDDDGIGRLFTMNFNVGSKDGGGKTVEKLNKSMRGVWKNIYKMNKYKTKPTRVLRT